MRSWFCLTRRIVPAGTGVATARYRAVWAIACHALFLALYPEIFRTIAKYRPPGRRWSSSALAEHSPKGVRA
ncbi:hypothetical protein [Phyllobacterium endophyticum]|uniref:hypothetical protein n=1 Tax=Phyllobacterium endophyticum TaxID=1149773 RepID=UPI0011C75090|nr:hypothetical protein [Phyllobacterium endophyticum]TXR46345.1 hypothetical protein FVA77_25545 [Phyllobacterium endophyticum]